jgi:GGDEF domain-containing protein
MFDADKLKQINDKRGHPNGDIYLQKIANFIRSNIRHDDFAARYGGDEFVTIMPNIDLKEYIKKYEDYIDNFYSTDKQPDALSYKEFLEKTIENHFTKALEKYNDSLDEEHRIYLSFGVASSFPIPGSTKPRTDIEENIKLADERMYAMKEEHHAQMEALSEI